MLWLVFSLELSILGLWQLNRSISIVRRLSLTKLKKDGRKIELAWNAVAQRSCLVFWVLQPHLLVLPIILRVRHEAMLPFYEAFTDKRCILEWLFVLAISVIQVKLESHSVPANILVHVNQVHNLYPQGWIKLFLLKIERLDKLCNCLALLLDSSIVKEGLLKATDHYIFSWNCWQIAEVIKPDDHFSSDLFNWHLLSFY